jgi:hypothetical protein
MTNDTTPTYHEPTFRTYPAEWRRHRGGVELLTQVCETYEGGKWEGFVAIKGARYQGQRLSIREAFGRADRRTR